MVFEPLTKYSEGPMIVEIPRIFYRDARNAFIGIKKHDVSKLSNNFVYAKIHIIIKNKLMHNHTSPFD